MCKEQGGGVQGPDTESQAQGSSVELAGPSLAVKPLSNDSQPHGKRARSRYTVFSKACEPGVFTHWPQLQSSGMSKG